MRHKITSPKRLVILSLCLITLFALWQPIKQRILSAREDREINRVFDIVLRNLDVCRRNEGRYPPPIKYAKDGSPLCSWRFWLIPIIESPQFAFDFSRTWTSEQNAAWRNQRVPIYNFAVPSSATEQFDTNIFAIVGDDTAFPREGVKTSRLSGNLIVICEVVNSKTHWMEPGDFRVEELTALPDGTAIQDAFGGVMKDRIHVGFADGTIWALKPETPMSRIKPFLTNASASGKDKEVELGEFRL